jgi:hypothetical protein
MNEIRLPLCIFAVLLPLTGCGVGERSQLDITGSYVTTEERHDGSLHTEPMNLTQNGADVSGWYVGTDDVTVGTVTGTLSGPTTDATWYQGGANGLLSLTFAPDGSSFTGYWQYAGGGTQYEWNGTRVSDTPQPGGSPTTNGQCSSDSDCSSTCGDCPQCLGGSCNCGTADSYGVCTY